MQDTVSISFAEVMACAKDASGLREDSRLHQILVLKNIFEMLSGVPGSGITQFEDALKSMAECFEKFVRGFGYVCIFAFLAFFCICIFYFSYCHYVFFRQTIVGRLTKSKKDAGEGVVPIKKTDTEYIKQILALQATMQRVLCVAFPLSVEERGKGSVDVLMGRAFQVGGAGCRRSLVALPIVLPSLHLFMKTCVLFCRKLTRRS